MKDGKEKQAGITALSTHTAGDWGAQPGLAGTLQDYRDSQ